MHVVVRTYSGEGVDKLFDLLEQRKTEIEQAIGAVSSLVSFTMARTASGGFSVTVCKDKAGCDESARIAREWNQKNAPELSIDAPSVTEASVIVQVVKS